MSTLRAAAMPVTALPHVLRQQDLSDDDFDAIVALGPAAVAPLIRIVEEGLEAPERWNRPAPMHALTILGHVADETAIEGLLHALCEAAPDDEEIAEAVETALRQVGPAALPPLLDLLDDVAGEGSAPQAGFVAETLSRLGCRDARLFAHMLRLLASPAAALGASLLADHGDPHALPHLSAALDGLPVDPNDCTPLSNIETVELAAAIEELGGKLGPAQEAKVTAVVALRHRAAAAFRRQNLDRNERCWCRSGKKYKACCLPADEAL